MQTPLNHLLAQRHLIELNAFSTNITESEDLIDPEVIESNCIELRFSQKKGKNPFDKYNNFTFGKTERRLYHNYFVMIPLDYNNPDNEVREVPLDSVITPRVNDHSTS